MKIQWEDHLGGVEPALLSLMQTAADCAVAAEGINAVCGISLQLVSDEEIHQINREYRQVDCATDVLSFPTVQYPKGKTAAMVDKLLRTTYDDEMDACMLGDIIISIPHVKAQADQYGHSLQREAAYLLVHGICHLMGYDHMNDEEQKEMRAMEEKALHMMGISREEDISVTDESLMALARQAMQRAYVPYSRFPVGAALLSSDGRVFQGCNVENASFGLTNCAERTAVFKAVSEGVKDFTAIAIASAGETPAWPCGACRQVLNEFAPEIRVMVTGADGHVEEATLPQLLPHSFGPKDLDSDR